MAGLLGIGLFVLKNIVLKESKQIFMTLDALWRNLFFEQRDIPRRQFLPIRRFELENLNATCWTNRYERF